MLSKDQLKSIMPFISAANLERYCGPLNDAMDKFEINTPLRQAAFLAQVAHESGCLKYTKELASGEDYDTGPKAASLGNTPEKDGDGQLYKGRGPIQITGKRNYAAAGKAIGADFIAHPELLEGPVYGSLSAAWFWSSRGLNQLADAQDFRQITRKINGGYNGYEQRLKYYENAKKVFGLK